MRSAVLLAVATSLGACVSVPSTRCGDLICPGDVSCIQVDGQLRCGSVCGDGVIGFGEDCDGELAPGLTCLDVQTTTYYEPGQLACGSNCQYDESGCSEFCGDTMLNGDEECDTSPPEGQTCVALGFDHGRVSCLEKACITDSRGCGRFAFAALTRASPSPVVTNIWGSARDDVYAIVRENSLGGPSKLEHFNGTYWAEADPGASGEYEAIWGSGPDDIHLVGDSFILHFDGTAWTETAFDGVSFSAIHGASATDVWAVGRDDNDGEVALHFDGSDWSSEPVPGATRLDKVWAGEAVVYAIDAASTVLRRQSGLWSVVDVGSSAEWFDVWGLGPESVWVGGRKGLNGPVLVHFDGDQWTEQATGLSDDVRRVHGDTSGRVFAAGLVAGIAVYDGVSWHPIASGKTGGGFHALWAAAGEVFAGGTYDEILLGSGSYLDAMTEIGDGEASNYEAIVSPHAGEAFVVGGTATRAIYQGAVWRSHEPPGEIGFKIHGAWGPTIDDLWIVGQDQGDGVVERLDGCNIEPDCVEEILRLPAQGLFGVHGFASGEAYAAGVTVLEKSPTDVWTPLPTPAGMPLLRAVWGPSPTEVFFAGHDGTVMFYDGSSFSFLTSRRPELGAPEEISDDALKAIWGTSSSEVWVGGQAGRVWHFDGASWTAVDTGAFGDIVSIAGTGSNDIFALSDSSLAHFDGATWTPVRLPSSEASYFALAVHPSRVYVVGARGAVVGIVRTEPWSP